MTEAIYDQHGFPHKWPDHIIKKYCEDILPRKNNLITEWEPYIKSLNGIENFKRCKQSKKLVRKGIPHELRPSIWFRLTECDTWYTQDPRLYSNLLAQKNTIPDKVKKIHEADIPRTFDGNQSFTHDQLRNVLSAFAVFRPEIGYCQGLNFIAALLIITVGEEKSFYLMSKLIDSYLPRNYYNNNLLGFRVDLKLLEALIEERTPQIFDLAKRLDFQWVAICSGWILTVFSNSFPPSTVLRIWDSLFYEGHKITFKSQLHF